MCTQFTLALVAAMVLAALPAPAQSPTPIVVQAIVPATSGATAAAAATGTEAITAPALKTLLQIKAANEDILRKQAATLLVLEEMEKAAEQIKIYTKRG